MRLTMSGAAASALVVVFAASAQAQSIDPAEFSGTMDVGESITIHKTITLGAEGANLVDLFFLSDDTGSMGYIIGNAKAGATDVMTGVPSGASYYFGAGTYNADCSEDYPPLPAGCSEYYYGYRTSAALSSSTAATQAGIDTWSAHGGGDGPEANLDALRMVATTTPWRTGSQRLVVWFGDAVGHTESTDVAGAIAALNAAGVTVIGFNAYGAGTGIDGTYGGSPNQASTITAATGGSLTNGFGSGTDFASIVGGAIETATSTLDLVFGASYGGPGLAFTFTCTDEFGTPNPALCMDVGGGETRHFDVTIEALAEGTYDFSVFAYGVDATEIDHIVVGAGGTVVPEPSTWLMLATGLLGLGFMGWRRKEEEGAA